MTELNHEVPAFMVLAYRMASNAINNPEGSDFARMMRLGYWCGVAQCLEHELSVISGETDAQGALDGLDGYISEMIARSQDGG